MNWLFGSKQKVEVPDSSTSYALKSLFGPEYNLSHLDLLETIGTGTFGRVRIVKDIKTKYFYALKIMKKARIVRLKQIEHILSEVAILSNLTCNFVVELSAVFQDDNSLYLLMEFCGGGELFSHLRRNEKFPPDVAKFYAMEVASGLKSMHKWNIVYRDLKPENIMICKDGHIKLVDFGFAKKMTIDSPYCHTLCGTPEYLAPETIRGIGHDRAVDWWALGILLYEMLVGFPPFFADNPFALYQKILKGVVKFPTNVVSSSAQMAIKGLLHLDRNRRMSYNNNTGFSTVEKSAYFKGIDWESVENKLIVPVLLPTLSAEGDTSNFDYYEEEAVEEVSNLNSAERALFHEFDIILGRSVQL